MIICSSSPRFKSVWTKPAFLDIQVHFVLLSLVQWSQSLGENILTLWRHLAQFQHFCFLGQAYWLQNPLHLPSFVSALRNTHQLLFIQAVIRPQLSSSVLQQLLLVRVTLLMTDKIQNCIMTFVWPYQQGHFSTKTSLGSSSQRHQKSLRCSPVSLSHNN